jgi:hypothetical protein
MANQSEQGTGKHPHKDSQEPWHHTEGSGSQNRSESRSSDSRDQQSASGTSQGGPASDSQDLKEREYRDNQGNIHHHTSTSKEMQGRKVHSGPAS